VFYWLLLQLIWQMFTQEKQISVPHTINIRPQLRHRYKIWNIFVDFVRWQRGKKKKKQAIKSSLPAWYTKPTYMPTTKSTMIKATTIAKTLATDSNGYTPGTNLLPKTKMNDNRDNIVAMVEHYISIEEDWDGTTVSIKCT